MSSGYRLDNLFRTRKRRNMGTIAYWLTHRIRVIFREQTIPLP